LTFIDGTKKPVSPGIENGKLYFGLKDDKSSTTIKINGQDVSVGNHRAYIFLDHENKRYAITGPIDWDDIFNKPIVANDITYTDSTKKLALIDTGGGEITDVTLPFVKTAGDTMTGPLSIAQDATEAGSLKKVTLDYNENTESLDFTFN
jgi:hypothetical protein